VSIKDNVEKVKSRIAAAAQRAGRDPNEIKLVAVIKNVPLDKVFEALEAGVTDIGESRIQEAEERYSIIKEKFPGVTYHMVGHLQRNKVGQALDMFDIIQSVDSERLVEEINKRAVKPIPVLIEVNTSGETSKFGVEPGKTIDLVRFASQQLLGWQQLLPSSFDKIKVQGLMTIGPLSGDPRESFKKLRELSGKIGGLKYLSMGMTDDFEVAIEEGSSLVRIGRGIFKGG
jgi:hypothetical protein